MAYVVTIFSSLRYGNLTRRLYCICDQAEYIRAESLNLAHTSSKRKTYFGDDIDDGEQSLVDEIYEDELNSQRFQNAQGTIAAVEEITNSIMSTCFGYSFTTIITAGGYAIYHNNFHAQSCDIIGCIDGSIVATTLLVQVTLPFFLSWSIPMSWRSIVICECLSNLCILANIFKRIRE